MESPKKLLYTAVHDKIFSLSHLFLEPESLHWANQNISGKKSAKLIFGHWLMNLFSYMKQVTSQWADQNKHCCIIFQMTLYYAEIKGARMRKTFSHGEKWEKKFSQWDSHWEMRKHRDKNIHISHINT